jgi:hypothetical protein
MSLAPNPSRHEEPVESSTALPSTLSAGDCPSLLQFLSEIHETDESKQCDKGDPAVTKPTIGALTESDQIDYPLTEALRATRTADLHFGVHSVKSMQHKKVR